MKPMLCSVKSQDKVRTSGGGRDDGRGHQEEKGMMGVDIRRRKG
jgi:hypothetical protein